MRMLQRPLKLYNAALHCLPLKADILYLGRLVSCVVFAASPAPGRGPEAANPNTQPAALQIRRRPRHFQIKDFCGCRLCASHVYKTSGAVGAELQLAFAAIGGCKRTCDLRDVMTVEDMSSSLHGAPRMPLHPRHTFAGRVKSSRDGSEAVGTLGTSNQFVVPEESEVVLVGALVSAVHQGTLPSPAGRRRTVIAPEWQ